MGKRSRALLRDGTPFVMRGLWLLLLLPAERLASCSRDCVMRCLLTPFLSFTSREESKKEQEMLGFQWPLLLLRGSRPAVRLSLRTATPCALVSLLARVSGCRERRGGNKPEPMKTVGDTHEWVAIRVSAHDGNKGSSLSTGVLSRSVSGGSCSVASSCV